MVTFFNRILGAIKRNGKTWTERRRHPRVRLVDHHLFYMKDSLVDTRAHRAGIIDVSRDGVFFSTEEDFRLGDELAIKLQIPFRNRYIRATGRVARVERDPQGKGFRVALRYQPLLAGPDEILYDTILDLLVREGSGAIPAISAANPELDKEASDKISEEEIGASKPENKPAVEMPKAEGPVVAKPSLKPADKAADEKNSEVPSTE